MLSHYLGNCIANAIELKISVQNQKWILNYSEHRIFTADYQ